MSTMENNTDPQATAEAKTALTAAMKTGKVRGKFKSSADVIAEGLARGEKETPDAEQGALINAAPILEEKMSFEDPFSKEEPTIEAKETIPVVADKEEVAPSTKTTAKKIKIGTRFFDTEEEAFAYAEELDRQKDVDDAFRQGIEAAQNTVNSNSLEAKAIPTPEEEEIPAEYYTNPAKYFREQNARVVAEAAKLATQQVAAQATHNETMMHFWNENPDLAKNKATKDLTLGVLSENFKALEKVPTDKALVIIAEKARKKLEELGVTTLPTKVLPSSTKPAASAGSSSAPTRPKTVEKVLNWTEQLKNMKRNKAASRRSR